MNEPMEQRLNEAMARLKATEEAVAKAEEDVKEASATAVSVDRSVQVTVGPQGTLVSVEFLDGKYKNMAAAQLSSAVLQAAEKARAEMARRVVDLFEPLTQSIGGGTFSDHVGVEWDKIFGSILDGAEREETSSSATDRLRDEIHEDGEETSPAPTVGGKTVKKRKSGGRYGQ
ncbi:YbaB/EbfC family nucleoid-associated protein [Streptomyces sp. NPDC002403]